MQSAQSTVYLTGVWLDRALDVSVAGHSLNFTVWSNTVDRALLLLLGQTAAGASMPVSDGGVGGGGSLSGGMDGGGSDNMSGSGSMAGGSGSVSGGSGGMGGDDSGMGTALLALSAHRQQRQLQQQQHQQPHSQPQPPALPHLHRVHVLQSGAGSVDECSGSVSACFPSVSLAGSDNSVLVFVAPVFNLTGYLPLVVTYLSVPAFAASAATPAAAVNWTGLDWMYYTAVECDAGMIVGLYCLPCPSGGYCPGGGRVWPLPGYWSFSETSQPVECALPQACPGALSSPTVTASGTRLTQVCAAGYAGAFCVDCDVGYYADLQRCLSCGLESAELTELVALLCIAAALFVSLSVAVAVASANHLSTAVSAVLVVQHLSVVGKLGGQQVPSSLTWLVQTFSIISMLNFDIQFVKPGCVVSVLSFLTVYWATLGLVVLASVLFMAASAVRALCSRRGAAHQQRDKQAVEADMVSRLAKQAEQHGLSPTQARRRSVLVVAAAATASAAAAGTAHAAGAAPGLDADWRWRFRARIIHSHLILGSILYLRLTTMAFQAVNCTDVVQADGSLQSVLQVDLTTPCYRGAHLWTAIGLAWPMLTVFSVGFPLLCFRLLYRSFHGQVNIAVQPQSDKGQADSVQADKGQASEADGGGSGGWVFSRGADGESEVEMSKLRSLKLKQAILPGSPRQPASAAPHSVRHVLSRRALLSSASSGEAAELSGSGESEQQPVLAYDTLWSVAGSGLQQDAPPGQLERSGTVSRMQGCRSPPQPLTSRLHTLDRATTHSSSHNRRVAPAASRSMKQLQSPGEVELVAPAGRSSDPATPASTSTSSKRHDTLRMAQLSAATLALRQLGADMRRQELLGYMYRQLKGELYYFRLLFFVTSFGFAAVSVLPRSPTLRLFLTGVFLALDVFTTCSMTPFDRWWRNVLSAAVSIFGVVQIAVMLALVQLGISSGDSSGVDLGHSKTAQQQSSDPSQQLTGASDQAAQYELYLGVLLGLDALAIGYVHRRSLAAAARSVRDTLQPPARHVRELCVTAAAAVGRALRTAWGMMRAALAAVIRTVYQYSNSTVVWWSGATATHTPSWREASVFDSVSFRAVGDSTHNTVYHNTTGGQTPSEEQPLDDEFEVEQEWQRMVQYTELLTPRHSEGRQQQPTQQQQTQAVMPLQQLQRQPLPHAVQDEEWPAILHIVDKSDTGYGQGQGRHVVPAAGHEDSPSVPPLPLSGLTGDAPSSADVLHATSEPALRHKLRLVSKSWRRASPHTRSVRLKVDTTQPPLLTGFTRSVPVSPFSAPIRVIATSRSPPPMQQPTSPSSSGTASKVRPSTPYLQSDSGSGSVVRRPLPVPGIAESAEDRPLQPQVERVSSLRVAVLTASLSSSTAGRSRPAVALSPSVSPCVPSQRISPPQHPTAPPTYSPSLSSVQRSRSKVLRLTEDEERTANL